MNCARAALAVGFALASVGGDELAPRKPIAHLAGFESSSSVRFESEPNRRHVLAATYIFPDRARWNLSVEHGAAAARTVQFHAGGRWYALDEGASKSREVAGAEQAQLARCFALREALFLWPDGRDWKSDGALQRARVDSANSLVARIAGDGRPTSIAWRDAQDRELDALSEVTWKSANGERAFPATMALVHDGAIVWRETVERVSTQIGYLDEYFTPPDRRAKSPLSSDGALEVQEVELAASTTRRIELRSDDAEERARIETQIAEWFASAEAEKLGLERDPARCFELARDARRVAVLVRAKKWLAEPPPGWTNQPAGRALTLIVPSEAAVTAKLLGALAERVPSDAESSAPYLRLGAGVAAVQVVLPIAPKSR